MKSAAPWIAAVALLTLCPMVAMSGVVFTSDLDDGTGWTIVADADTSSEFGFDYSPLRDPVGTQWQWHHRAADGREHR